jgi:hypothetical protein
MIRKTEMSAIVSTAQQVLGNIPRFEKELKGSPELQNRLAYARAWYASRDGAGKWHFGPSKFIGYKGMTAEQYVNDDPLDGRQTERKLNGWFVEVPEHDALHEELSEGLTTFLAQYGKAPSAKARINVTPELYEEWHSSSDEAPLDHSVANLIIVVARRLSLAERARIRDAI